MNMTSMTDECLKIAGVSDVVRAAMERSGKLKWPLILGAGYLGGKTVEQAGKDYLLGRRIRQQYAQQG